MVQDHFLASGKTNAVWTVVPLKQVHLRDALHPGFDQFRAMKQLAIQHA
jgi:hypothetical protein